MFLPGCKDPWFENGVWDYDDDGEMRLLKRRYFDLKTEEDFQGNKLVNAWQIFTKIMGKKELLRKCWLKASGGLELDTGLDIVIR